MQVVENIDVAGICNMHQLWRGRKYALNNSTIAVAISHTFTFTYAVPYTFAHSIDYRRNSVLHAVDATARRIRSVHRHCSGHWKFRPDGVVGRECWFNIFNEQDISKFHRTDECDRRYRRFGHIDGGQYKDEQNLLKGCD